MTITNEITLSAGANVKTTNAYCYIDAYVNSIKSTGKVPCDLRVYYSKADCDAGASPIYPVVDGKHITNLTLEFTPNEVIDADPNCTMEKVFAYFDQKAIAVMLASYGWVVTE